MTSCWLFVPFLFVPPISIPPSGSRLWPSFRFFFSFFAVFCPGIPRSFPPWDGLPSPGLSLTFKSERRLRDALDLRKSLNIIPASRIRRLYKGTVSHRRRWRLMSISPLSKIPPENPFSIPLFGYFGTCSAPRLLRLRMLPPEVPSRYLFTSPSVFLHR